MNSKQELRQLLTDVGVLFKDFEDKFKQVGREIDEETGKKIDALIRKKFNIEAKNKIAGSQNRVSKGVVNRMMKEIRREVYKKENLDFFEIIDAIKELPEQRKLDVLEYTLQRLQIEKLNRKQNKIVELGNFDKRAFGSS